MICTDFVTNSHETDDSLVVKLYSSSFFLYKCVCQNSGVEYQ